MADIQKQSSRIEDEEWGIAIFDLHSRSSAGRSDLVSIILSVAVIGASSWLSSPSLLTNASDIAASAERRSQTNTNSDAELFDWQDTKGGLTNHK
jgi:hypothetical protein